MPQKYSKINKKIGEHTDVENNTDTELPDTEENEQDVTITEKGE